MIADTNNPFTHAAAQHLVTAAVIGIFGAWAARNARRDASRNRNGDYVLEHGLAGKTMVVFCWAVGSAVTVAFYLKRPESSVWLGFAGGTVALGYFLSAAIFGTRIVFDALEIRPRTPWNRSRVIPWSKVEAVEGTKAGGYRVRTAADGKLYIHPHFSGVNTFLTEAGRHRIPVIPFRA